MAPTAASALRDRAREAQPRADARTDSRRWSIARRACNCPFVLGSAARCGADHLRDRVAAYRLNDTALGDDGPNKSSRSDVECRVIDIDPVGGCLTAEAVGDFLARSLFDRNLVAVGDREVEGR